jgi:translation initiation factor 2B subunit (eIF-2B alpha/beta/delta family)
MNRLKSYKLDRILNNKTSGSSELVQILNSYFLSIHKNKSEILRSIRLVKARLGHFEEINSYIKQVQTELVSEPGLLIFLRSHSIQQKEKVEIIFKKIYSHSKDLNGVITLSRSGTVLTILKLLHQKNKKLRVVVCESRPKLEGRLIAKELAANGIKVELITDAMLGLFIPKVNAAIIGADVVLNNGNIVNKVGSKALALLCREYKKPLFVVTAKSKLSKKKSFKQKKENPKEVWDKNVKNLSISNIYFEEIEKKFITKIFME